ncbi:MAG: hypothetical protein IJ306_06500 [Oscillospiraceae bacterium]|nr:hypothetical protein [Oscillospiraceae bacterium]
MTSKKELSDLTLRFQARTLNIYRKLFFDLQERDYSIELRDRSAKLAKAIKEEDYPEAKSQAENITYLFKLAYQANLILPTVYQSLAVDGLTLCATIEEAINGEIGPDPEPEIIPVEEIPTTVRKYIPGGNK